MPIYMSAPIHVYTCPYVHVCLPTCLRSCIHLCLCACSSIIVHVRLFTMHTHIHTCVNSYLCASISVHTRMHCFFFFPPDNPSKSTLSSNAPSTPHMIATNSRKALLCRPTQQAPLRISYIPNLLHTYSLHVMLHNPLPHMPCQSSIRNPLISRPAHTTSPTKHLRNLQSKPLCPSSPPAAPSSTSSSPYLDPFTLSFTVVRTLTSPPPGPPTAQHFTHANTTSFCSAVLFISRPVHTISHVFS